MYIHIYLPKYSEAFFEILRKNTHSFPEFVHKNFGLIGFRELHVTLGGCVWKKVEVTSSRKKKQIPNLGGGDYNKWRLHISGFFWNLKMLIWVVATQIFLYFHPENWGRWTHVDDNIFQMGWNHQPVIFCEESPRTSNNDKTQKCLEEATPIKVSNNPKSVPKTILLRPVLSEIACVCGWVCCLPRN